MQDIDPYSSTDLDNHPAPYPEHKNHVDKGAAPVQPGAPPVTQIPPAQEVIQRLTGTVRRALRHRRIAANDMDDVAQEVFLVIARRLPDFRAPKGIPLNEALAIWACAICKYCARTHHRRRQPWLLTLRMEKHPADQPETADLLLAKERWDILMDALAQIAPERRSVLVAHELEGQTIPEIAEAQAIGEATAYTRLRLARADLEEAGRRLSTRQRAVLLPLLVFFLEERRTMGQRRRGTLPLVTRGSIALAAVAAALLCARSWGEPPARPMATAAAAAGRTALDDLNGERAKEIAAGTAPAATHAARPAPPADGAHNAPASGARQGKDERDTGEARPRRERDERVYIEVARERLAAGRPDATRQILRNHARTFPGGGYPTERATLRAGAAPRP